jgi:predicted amidohydrolase YtcJ
MRLGAGILLSMATVLAAASPAAAQNTADLVLTNGKVVTMDPDRPQAEAIAIRGDRILAIGSSREMQAYAGPKTRVLDLGGKLAIPGFIEGHGHYTSLGRRVRQLRLERAHNWQDIVDMVAEAARTAPKGQWILGRGWHQEKWNAAPVPVVEGFPVHEALSRVSPDHPVLLTHASGHAAIANARALSLAGINERTPDPVGGEILHDASKRPTGVLRETAQRLVSAAYDKQRAGLTEAQQKADLRLDIETAGSECLARGITTFEDAGSPFQTLDVMREMADAHALPVRLWVMARDSTAALARNLGRYREVGRGGGFLTVRAIKVAIDGALGPRGAWLLEPYDDLPGHTGLNTTPVDTVRVLARLALEHDMQLCVHAIGDRANRETLDLYEAAFRGGAAPASTDTAAIHKGPERRWRIEHAQHLHPDDVPRFATLGVIASMQGIHCTSDAPWVPPRLGDQRAASGAYLWRSLMNAGVVIINGTDAPVEDVDPIACFYASVSRRTSDGSVFYGDQKMTREEALASYTRNGAYGAFEEDIKGTLAVGKLADVTVLTKDILTCPEAEILDARVAWTILGGRVAYTAAKP